MSEKKIFAMFSGSYDMAYKMCNIYQDICSFPVDLPMEYWKQFRKKYSYRLNQLF